MHYRTDNLYTEAARGHLFPDAEEELTDALDEAIRAAGATPEAQVRELRSRPQNVV